MNVGWFFIRRRAWWADLKMFFATLFGIMHRVAGRVSVSLCQIFLKRFSKNVKKKRFNKNIFLTFLKNILKRFLKNVFFERFFVN